jgi:hypothetical protein
MKADKLNESLNQLHSLMEESKNFKILLDKFISNNTHSAGLELYIFCSSILKRSNAIVLAIKNLTEKKNYIAASVLPRVLADNAMRAYGLCLVGVSTPYFEAIKNDSVRKLKSVDGNKLTDKFLHKSISKSELCKDFSDKYKESSSYVHFSHPHARQAITKLDLENSIANFNIAPTNYDTDWNDYLPITENAIYFVRATYAIINKVLNGFH